ncbi:MAG: hypothetical protein RJA57_95, partial [Bacteroidota bacterium]
QLVHVHIPMKAGLIARWLKKRYRIPYVVTEHWGIYNDVLPKRFAKRSGIFRHLTRTIFEGSACFISVSRFLAEQVHRQVVPIQAQVIPNVVNTELFFPGTVLPSRFRFIHVSNMVPLKNAEGILRAFSRTKASGVSADLVMVGPAGKALRQLADSLGLQEPELRFTGEIPYEAVAAEMRSANALVLFSEMENAPCVIAEALCCGLPVIATRVGGIPELIDDRKGLLIPSRDETALVGALAHVFEEYGSYDRGGMAQEAAAAFNFRTVGASMDAAYRSITGGSEAISP